MSAADSPVPIPVNRSRYPTIAFPRMSLGQVRRPRTRELPADRGAGDRGEAVSRNRPRTTLGSQPLLAQQAEQLADSMFALSWMAHAHLRLIR